MTWGRWGYRNAWRAQVERFQGNRCPQCGLALPAMVASGTLCASCYLAWYLAGNLEKREQDDG